MTIRQQLEAQEEKILAPYALKNNVSKGRKTPEKKDEYRLEYTRDRDRILHTKAFRRLKGKTQVFVAHYGDHYRSRLTHSLEVAQIARTLARIFRANEDVVEAVALAHDLGHTPFGHAGQEILAKKLQPFGERFEHNAQSRRILETLEPKNLTREVLSCLCKHPTNAEKEEYNLSPQNFLEGQIVDIADSIAYTCHDLQDGLSSGILDPKDFDFVPKNMLDAMVTDIAEQGIQTLGKFFSPQEIRNHESGILQFSPKFFPVQKKLKDLLFKKMYHHPMVLEQTSRGEKILAEIFDFLSQNPQKIPTNFEVSSPVYIRIRDFIAGMTDSFAEKFWKENCL